MRISLLFGLGKPRSPDAEDVCPINLYAAFLQNA
jgi:hypothetical protein